MRSEPQSLRIQNTMRSPGRWLWVILASVMGLLDVQAQEGSAFKAYCHSVALRPAHTSLGTTIVFSTPKGTDYPFFDVIGNQLVVGNELRPLPGSLPSYEAGFGHMRAGQFIEYGVALMEVPATDSDGNGVPDFAQVDSPMSGTFPGTINVYGPTPYTAKLVVTVSRSAGSTTGTYNAFAVVAGQPVFYDGESVVSSASGAVTYNPAKSLIAFGGVLSGELGTSLAITAVGSYAIQSGNVVLSSMPIKTPKGTLTALATILTRVPGTLRFRGSLSLVDGNLSTSWPDYTRWTLEITDADVNQNGVPDIAEGAVLAPTITVQPTPTTVIEGQTATLSLTARGSAPLTYQWRFKGNDIVGATSETLTINTAQRSDEGDYTAIVSNAAGSTTSSVARLTVKPRQPAGLEGFVWIVPGTFTMGSPLADLDRYENETERVVSIPNGFWLCDHEVTQAEYQTVMGSNPASFQGDLNRPVEMVAWVDAAEYCRRLTEREQAAGRITAQQAYRLPTEAEWEYAARAGTTSPRYGDLNAIAWWGENSGGQTHAVKGKQPNAWGLFDTIGNVFEWCHDTSGAKHEFRSGRGASWYDWRRFARAAFRGWNTPTYRDSHTGFRVAMGKPHAPEILSQTSPMTLLQGDVAVLEITPHGSQPLSYRWMKDGRDVIGGTGSRLMITNAQIGDSGEYHVVVTNSAGGVTSTPVALSVRSVVLEALPGGTVSGDTQPRQIKVRGVSGTIFSVEKAASAAGPWKLWIKMSVGTEGAILEDADPQAGAGFYRAVSSLKPDGPEGFVWIEPGTFVMGSPRGEPERYSDEVQHTVTLTQGFWLSDHEVTQAEYQAVMGSNPSRFRGDTLPVETVSWDDAVLYCQNLTERERAAGRITAQQAYRLPTESEWEYAARAGTTGARHGELDAIAWYSGNSGGQTRPVKQKQPNAWGLHDMLGNVWEWCEDWYWAYPTGSVTDPTGPGSGSLRVRRGGSWILDGGGVARSADRNGSVPGDRYSHLGFRPALSSVR